MTYRAITTKSAIYTQAKALLDSYDLDTSDIVDARVKLWSLEDKGQLLGVVGLEQSMEIGLLRSLAVSKDHQGRGLAKMLCQAVFDYASAQDIPALYLLTETAATFFTDQGFLEISRDQAPEGLKATRQFSSLCPDSATVMARVITKVTAKVS